MAAAAEPVTAPRRLGFLAVPAVAGVLASVLTRLPHLRDITLFDVDTYLTLGQQWWHGLTPYQDLFDNKGQFTFELFAVLSAVLPRSLLAVHVFHMAIFALSVWQLAALAGRHLDRTGTWVAAVAYGIAGSAIAFEGTEPNGDQLALIAVVAAVDAADRYRAGGLRRWAAVAGLALALAAGIKLPQLIVLPVVAGLLVARPDRRVAGLLVAAVAFAVVTALTLVPYALQGALGDVRFVLFEYSRTYVRLSFEAIRERSWAAQVAYFIDGPGIPLVLAAVALGAVAWRDRRTRLLAVAGLVWLAAAWVFARSTGRTYPHYYVGITAPAALLLGAGVDALGRRAPQVRTAVAALALAAVCAPLVIENYETAMRTPAASRWMAYDVRALQSVDEAAADVRAMTDPDDRVFVATGGGGTSGGVFLYWLADRRPAYRIFYPGDVVPPRFEEVSAALARNPPDVLVVIPGTRIDPYRDAIANGDLEVVKRYPGAPGDELEVYARP